jgi:hypothetical protein
MNYEKIYTQLVERGISRTLICYTEKHHIVPRCMGGSDDSENLVELTPEEHYLAHQLLVKIYPDNHALAKAAMMMTAQRPSNKVYGWLRKRHSEAMSDSQSGETNSQFGTRWIYNLQLEENKKIPANELLPDDWEEGRIMNFSAYKDKILKEQELSLRKQKEKHDDAYRWYFDYINSGYSSLREYVRNSDYPKSHVSFIKMLKKYVSGFKPEHGKAFGKT